MDYEVLERGTIEVEYVIRRHDQDDNLFDWSTASDESDDWFGSVDEALQDLKDSLTGSPN